MFGISCGGHFLGSGEEMSDGGSQCAYANAKKIDDTVLLKHIDNLITAAHGARPCVLAAHREQQINHPLEVTAAGRTMR